MARTPYENRHAEHRAGLDADQVEFKAVRYGSAVIDAAADDERISGVIDDYDIGLDDVPLEEWQALDLRQEVMVGDAHKVILERESLLGADYPFKVKGSRLEYAKSASGMYEFCLAIVNARSITSDPYTTLPRLFERATAGLVKKYFGEDTKALHVGWPREPNRRIKEVLQWLTRDQEVEWVWRPQDGLSVDPDHTAVKDEGVDFIIIKRLMDRRGGRLYVFGQCACGDNWDDKLREPDIEKLRKWFNPDYLVSPLSAFTTPYLLGHATLRETARESRAIVFDRARLVTAAQRWATASRFSRLHKLMLDASNLVYREGEG